MNPPPASGRDLAVRVIAARDLEPGHVATWSAWQAADPALGSPFFRPEFSLAVGAVRDDARVAIFEDAAGVAGFFPFQTGSDGVGGPMGGLLSDYQGAITRADLRWDAVQLIRRCGLRLWRFDHLLAGQKAFAGFHRVLTSSPVMDLSAGYEAYVEERRRAGTEQIVKALGLRRKLEREAGPVRVATHVADPEMLKALMLWKSAQFVASGKVNLFALPWVVQTLERIMASQHEAFAGMLSVLYAGDRPVAAHLGMRSQTVWHYWLPAYDPVYHQYSPGILLLLGMAEEARSLGLRVIDLGCGRASYKQRLMNGAVAIAEGEVASSPFRSTVALLRNRAKGWVRGHRLLVGPLRKLKSLAHGFEDRLRGRDSR